MTRMIALLVVVIILFAAAAGGSWYLQMQNAKDSDGPQVTEEKSAKSAKSGVASAGKQNARDNATNLPLIRPASTSDADRLSQLALALQQQKSSLETREKEVGVREKQMDIVHNDIKKEQKRLEVVRKEIQGELVVVQEKLELLEKRSLEGVSERKVVESKKKELDESIVNLDVQKWTNLNKQIKTFEKIDAEQAAVVVVQMVDQGNFDTAVSILSQMRDRQGAAIFAEITKQDPKLASQLFEGTLRIKTPVISAPK